MTTAAELTCQELVEVITAYLEGALAPADRERFEAHLSSCSGCREYLRQMRATVRALGRLTGASLPPAVRDELLAVFRTWKHA